MYPSPQVTPVTGRDWSEEAVGWFRATVRSRMFYARLNTHGPEVTVELFFEKGKLGAMRYLKYQTPYVLL